MKTAVFLFCLFSLCFLSFQAKTQTPFAEDIKAFKKADSIRFPEKNGVLFIGSSSFTMWKNMQQDFPEYKIINRAFGGSQLLDVLRYEKEVVFNYHPKQVVIYCGENDLAADEKVTGRTVFERFKKLYSDIRKNFPVISIAYVSMKPSPSRQHLRTKMEEGNQLINKFLKAQKNASFIDVYSLMLNKNGMPKSDYFLQDSLHMNAEGYKVWRQVIKPILLK